MFLSHKHALISKKLLLRLISSVLSVTGSTFVFLGTYLLISQSKVYSQVPGAATVVEDSTNNLIDLNATAVASGITYINFQIYLKLDQDLSTIRLVNAI